MAARTKLYNYSKPFRAHKTLRELEALRPECKFEIVLSPLATYAFRWLIEVTMPNGRKAFVQKRG